jgi:signal transduction histidine kinase/DNA-binding response OmpR family regulator
MRAENIKMWCVLANVCRDIAKIQEIHQQSEEAYENLLESKSLIEQHKLDSSYAAFAVRYSSWHRVFGNKDSAYFYAEKAIQKAQKYGKIFEEAEGNLLLSLLEPNEELAIPYSLKALYLYQKIDVYTSSTSMHSNLATMYAVIKDYEKALSHIDTAILYTERYLEGDDYYNYRNYYLKASVYRGLGQMDSALIYSIKSHEAEFRYLENDKQQQILEIGKKYDFEKKNQELQTEKAKNGLLLVTVTLFILFGVILSFYYLKLRKANELTRKQSEELKALDKTKTRFFANVSHELRTSLSLITGPIKTLLKESQLDLKQENLLKIAKQGSSNLESLVNEILDLSKMEAGKMELQPEATPISAYFEHYLKQFESLSEFKEVHYQYLIKVQKSYTAMIDREKMRQILFNLLSNAFKFTPPNGKVNVTVYLKKGKLHLHATDTGKGIHPEDLPNIFDRYFQTYQEDTNATGGTGLGLAICNEYAKLFGGKIEVSSQLGVGSTFEVEFPIKKAQESSSAYSKFLEIYNQDDKELIPAMLETHKLQQKNGEQPTLLLVEDNRDLQNYMCLILQNEYKIITAGNGQKALEILEKKENDLNLIITDLMMPVMDGYQLLEKLKSSPATNHISTIMLTARVGKDDHHQGLRVGVDSYLTKPFDEEELKIHIKNLLNNQAVRKETLKEIEEEAKQGKKQVELDNISSEKEMKEPIATIDLSASEEKMQNIEDFVQDNISNKSLSVSLLEDKFAMSESTLLRFLKHNTGLSTKKYITEIRLNLAREMIENSQYDSISRVAIETGYSDVRTFSRSFKNRFGKLPSQIMG